MSVLYIALPVALLVALLFVIAFVYQVRSGQLDDLETPQRRMLYDDVQTTTPSTKTPLPKISTTQQHSFRDVDGIADDDRAER